MIDYKALFENMQIIDEYLTEKVEWKRNLNSLLRKFNYNHEKGTIKYQGNEYKIKISRNENTSGHNDIDVDPSQIRKGTMLTDNTITLNPNDFKYKSLDDMETTLLHEIGHPNVNYDTKTLDPKTAKMNAENEKKYNNPRLGDVFSKYLKINGQSNLEKDLRIAKLIDKLHNGEKLSDSEYGYLDKKGILKHHLNKNGKGFIERNKFANNTEKITSHTKNHQYHSNQQEFEADRYAADHLPHGNNRLSHYLNNNYNEEHNKYKGLIKDAVIKSHPEFSSLSNLKKLENSKRKVEDSNWKQVDINGKTYSRKEALSELDKKILKSKMGKNTLKQSRSVKDSLKDPNSDLSKEINKYVKRRDDIINNDIKSRKRAIEASKYSDTKAFTTLNDKGTETDRDNKPKNINGKSTQRNMMAYKK